jgi:hypothetical protein
MLLLLFLFIFFLIDDLEELTDQVFWDLANSWHSITAAPCDAPVKRDERTPYNRDPRFTPTLSSPSRCLTLNVSRLPKLAQPP